MNPLPEIKTDLNYNEKVDNYFYNQLGAKIGNFIHVIFIDDYSVTSLKEYYGTGFEKYLKNITGPTWRPDRHNYGYTFGKNKGLIKKLVDYLDKGYDNGTKLDFLEYIGKLKSKVVDGKKQYAHSYGNVYHPSNQWRGHFASFFASAKNAGIIDYTKDGSKFIVKPGPNFEAFKKGELKAL